MIIFVRRYKHSHSTDKCTTLKVLIKWAKSSRTKGYETKKIYSTHEVNELIKKKLKKAFKGKKKCKRELCKKMDVSESKESAQSLDVSNASSKSDDS